jgi:hypothetical protein
LINPLIPSRGLSGGGLARQHGHLSGGYTTGHFHKGADGKVHFKAANRYADKADWEKEVRAGAAGVVAKQEAAKAAVQKAEDATNLTEKLAGEKAPKAAQAAAHAAAAAAHQDAVKHFQAMGQDGLKSGVLTHSAHSAIHSSKAGQLEAAAKAEKLQKQVQRKELATGLSKKANDLSASTKESTALPKEKAALHQKAAASHLAAQKANEAAGNHYVADAHGKAAAKHEAIAAHQLEKHKQLEHGAGVKSNKAATASKSAKIAGEEGDSFPSQLAAHQNASTAHEEAATAHKILGNTKVAQDHLTSKMSHNTAIAQLKEKQAAHEATTAENDKLKGAANAAYQKAIGMPEDTVSQKVAKVVALKEASQKTGAAMQHGAKHDLPDDHLITAKHEQMTDFAKQLKGEIEQAHKAKVEEQKAQAKLNQAAFDASDTAKTASQKANSSGTLADHWAAHDAHQAAGEAAGTAGHGSDIQQYHAKQQEAHLDKIAKIQEEQEAEAEKAKAAKKAAMVKALDLSDAAKKASIAAENTPHGKALIGKHLDAAAAHLDASEAAKNATAGTKLAEHHKDLAKEHTETAKKLATDIADANQKAGDFFNNGDDAETFGDTSAAAHNYKKAAEQAELAGNPAMKVNALHALATLTGTKEDHKEAAKAALKALVAENKKSNPSTFYQNKYEHLSEEHLAAIDKIGETDQHATAKADAYKAAADEVDKATQKVITSAGLGAQPQADAHYGAAQAHQVAAEAAKSAGLKKEAKSHAEQVSAHTLTGNKKQAEANLKKKMTQEKAEKQAVQEPAASGEKPLKPVGELTNTGRTLGTHGSQLMKDEAGNEWLKKTDDYSRVLDPAIASLQRKIGMDTPVFVKTKEGHLQGMLPDAKDAFPNGNFDPEKLSEEDLAKMLQHQVLDYVTGNQDTHSGQWLRTSDGKLIQIDQGQAFKFGVGKGSGGSGKGDPTTTYPPIGANSPIYPKLWHAAEAGKIHIPDPSGDNDFAKTIKAIQDMPDEQFKALFKPYAVQAMKNGHNPGGHTTVDGFLNDIAEHKSKIGSDFQKLYDELPANAKSGAPEAPASPGPNLVTGSEPGKKANALEAIKTYAVSAKGQPMAPWMHQMAKEAGLSDAEIHKAFQDGPKEIALKEVATQAANGTVLGSGAITKAKEAGASLDEIHKVMQDAKAAKTAAPTAGPSEKEKALKALAEHEHHNNIGAWTYTKSDKLENAAKEAGASPQEIQTAFEKPQEVLNALSEAPASTPSAPEPSGLSAKHAALKTLAEYSDNPPDNWSLKEYQKLKEAAAGAGASNDELNAAQYTPGTFLKNLPAMAAAEPSAPATPAAPSAPAGPKVDPFKPKAKWSKGVAGLAYPGGEKKQTDVLAGPKGLVVHKATTGTGWSVSSSDGLNMGGVKFKTQKEAKLAAEWMAKNHGAPGSITTESHKEWAAANPEKNTAFKQGINASQWNKDAQAELDKHNGVTPITSAAPASPEATASATPHIAYTGLSNDKVANAQLLKKLYNQANSPNATAADKAAYVQAKYDWDHKHSSPFDPSKVLLPGQLPEMGSTPNPQKGKKPYPVTPGYQGWKPYNPAEGSTHGIATTDRTKLAEITKHQWSDSTYQAGFRSASTNESLHGDWKPNYKDAGSGSGPYIYSTGSYTSINQQLRGDKKKGIAPFGPTGGKWDDVIAHMDTAFDDVPPLDRDIVLSRKMYGGGPFPTSPPAPPMKPGEEYIDHGYNSTSKTREVWSGDTHMEIRVPKGAKVLDLNHSYGSDNATEHEVLLNRESKFRVIEDTTSTWQGQKVRHIIVELVP